MIKIDKQDLIDVSAIKKGLSDKNGAPNMLYILSAKVMLGNVVQYIFFLIGTNKMNPLKICTEKRLFHATVPELVVIIIQFNLSKEDQIGKCILQNDNNREKMVKQI